MIALSSIASPLTTEVVVYRYNICNGLSNQLLNHCSSLALAIQLHRKQRKDQQLQQQQQQKQLVRVEIPNHFIVDGTQGATGGRTMPTRDNSVPLQLVFDTEYLIQALQQQYGLAAQLVTFFEPPPARSPPAGDGDFNAMTSITSTASTVAVTVAANNGTIPCSGLQDIQQADPSILLEVFWLFKPSKQIKEIIDSILHRMELSLLGNASDSRVRGAATSSSSSTSSSLAAVCVHHRDAQDWLDHCGRWSSIPDGIYRGNCLGDVDHPEAWIQRLMPRGLQSYQSSLLSSSSSSSSSLDTSSSIKNSSVRSGSSTSTSWVYYCGDHEEIPLELQQAAGTVVSKHDFLTQQHANIIQGMHQSGTGVVVRDLWALLDFMVCQQIPSFVGNSVSTFSAIQIALRDGHGAYWYNSQSIPWSGMWKTYPLPIVYTYLDKNSWVGIDNDRGMASTSPAAFLKASIISIRRHLPNNPIHVFSLVADAMDKKLETWLRSQSNLQIHLIQPSYAHVCMEPIQVVPYIQYEYALWLDAATTRVRQPFTLFDFGLELTTSVASASTTSSSSVRSNSSRSVAHLLNIPHLRTTAQDLVTFLQQTSHSKRQDCHALYEDFFQPKEGPLTSNLVGPYPKSNGSSKESLGPLIASFSPGEHPLDDLVEVAMMRQVNAKSSSMPFPNKRCSQHFVEAAADWVGLTSISSSSLLLSSPSGPFCITLFPEDSEQQQHCQTLLDGILVDGMCPEQGLMMMGYDVALSKVNTAFDFGVLKVMMIIVLLVVGCWYRSARFRSIIMHHILRNKKSNRA